MSKMDPQCTLAEQEMAQYKLNGKSIDLDSRPHSRWTVVQLLAITCIMRTSHRHDTCALCPYAAATTYKHTQAALHGQIAYSTQPYILIWTQNTLKGVLIGYQHFMPHRAQKDIDYPLSGINGIYDNFWAVDNKREKHPKQRIIRN